MREFINLSKALADQTRLRILLALRHQDLCVCQITELFGLAPSTMSRHLFLLKHAGMLDSRKEGRWIFYALSGTHAPDAVRQAIDWVRQSLKGNPRIIEDEHRLKEILKCDPVELCKKQSRR